jgi:hypothetical protein
MTISMFQASAPVFVQGLKGLDIVLDKAAAYAAEKKIDPAVLLHTRLFPDMFPFVRQVQIVTDNAKGCMSRLAGQTPPSYEDVETSFEELKARVAKTLAHVESFTADQVDGSEDRPITLKFPGGERHFVGQTYLLGHVLPNFFFHYATAYDLMRHNGVELAKKHFLGAS